MRKIIGLCVLACCLCIFLAACSAEHDNNGEAESTSNEEVGEAGEVVFENDDTEGVGEVGDSDFDIENTLRVLEEVLGYPVDEGDGMVALLEFVGIRGVVRAQWWEPSEPLEPPRRLAPSLTIESEDGRIYRLFGSFSPMDGRFIVTFIRDEESGEGVFEIVLGGRDMPAEIDLETLDFDLERTIQVLYNAIDTDETRSRSIRHHAAEFFSKRRIRGAIHAEQVENTRYYAEFSNGNEIFIKIETEDNRSYLLVLRPSAYRILGIIDVETGNTVHEHLDEFDYGNAIRVIENALNIVDGSHNVRSAIRRAFPEANIKGAIHAEQVQVEEVEDFVVLNAPFGIETSDVLIKIETEDNRHFLLILAWSPNYSLDAVMDLETGEAVFPNW